MPDTVSKPTVIIPDTAPLVHLAGADALGVLKAIGRVVVPDVVAYEATRRQDKPFAVELAAWLGTGVAEVVDTGIGVLYKAAIQQGSKPPRNAGELAIIEWLRDHLTAESALTFVVYEDKRLPKMVAQEDLAGTVAVLTTRSLLDLAEQEGIIPSAAAAWVHVLKRAPTASPMSTRTIVKPSP